MSRAYAIATAQRELTEAQEFAAHPSMQKYEGSRAAGAQKVAAYKEKLAAAEALPLDPLPIVAVPAVTKTAAIPPAPLAMPPAKTPVSAGPPTPTAFDYKQHLRPMQALLDNPPPPIKYVVPGLFARGASVLLIGKPKSFKSTLACQIAIGLCGNPDLFDRWAEFAPVVGAHRVVVIDYEQSEQIAAQLLARFRKERVPGFQRIDTFPKLDEEGIEALRGLIAGEKLDAVIIDSWTRAQPELRSGKGVFMGEGEIMQRLTNLAHETGCLIIVIAHGGKRDAADDPMQMIAGTNALPASVDDVLVLYKDGDDEGATIRRNLFVSGRNIPKPGTYVLERHVAEAHFVVMGNQDTLIRGEARQKIVALLNMGDPLNLTAIGKALDMPKSNVHRTVEGLARDRLVISNGDGRYTTLTARADAIRRKMLKE